MKSTVIAIGICLAFVTSGCTQVANTINSNDPAGTAKNIAICTATQQPLTLLSQQVDAAVTSETAKVAATKLTGLLTTLESATGTATGQLATTVTGLDTSVKAFITALSQGASTAELTKLGNAVKAQITAYQTQCATYCE